MDKESKKDLQILEALTDHLLIRKIKKYLGVSQRRIQTIKTLTEQSPLEISEVKHDRGRPKTITPEIEQRVVALTLQFSDLSDAGVADLIRHEFYFQLSSM